MNQTISYGIISCLYSIVIFLVGFSIGNIRAQHKGIKQELGAAENLFNVSGDNPQQIKATLELMKIQKQKELGGTKRQILSIWLPSILVVINIIVTLLSKK